MSANHNPFELMVVQYDAWFDADDGRIIFAHEVACLRELTGPTTGRWLEVGVGTGRFAVALGVGEGVDRVSDGSVVPIYGRRPPRTLTRRAGGRTAAQ